ncbi:unnamed protein product [Adineta steineri]|uniref:F-box domain-containing protein n=1 Tax=Adineta steineri TaxID=433720 RepID=A0A814KAR6_9BILA|nr:unnamed protein product [Adineta steineri]CAF1048521.1 unnamed protein product [Adineta steineri]
MSTQFEYLANELLIDIFNYVCIQDSYKSFWGLNQRLDNLLLLLNKLSVKINNKYDVSLTKAVADRIIRLEVDIIHNINWKLFSNLRSLILGRITFSQSNEIARSKLPNLTYLSILSSGFDASSYLAYQIFSNWFPSLRYANLDGTDFPYGRSWSQSPNLRSVCVISSDPILLSLIPTSCPNLHQFRIKLVSNSNIINLPPSSDQYVQKHPLKHLTLFDNPGYLTLDRIDVLLNFLSNIEKLNLVLFDISFCQLVHMLCNRLPHLCRFDCNIRESKEQQNQNIDIDTIRSMHPCFNRIQCSIGRNGWRIYTTHEENN